MCSEKSAKEANEVSASMAWVEFNAFVFRLMWYVGGLLCLN